MELRDLLDSTLKYRLSDPDARISNYFPEFNDHTKITDAEISAGVTPVNYAWPFGDVRRYGAKGDGVTDDTTALKNAIDVCVPSGSPIYLVPGGTHIVTPGTAQTGAASYNTALELKSNLRVVGRNGSAIKVANNYSTDASPKELAIFSTTTAVFDISFEGVTFDLNGANNKMSPSRPSSYNSYNHAAIICNGPDGMATDVLIDKCTFQNSAGVCYVVCALVAAGTTPDLGERWTITNNLFINGGSDSIDHTSVYAWCEDVLCDGNTFWQDSPPHTVGKTGGATCYEVHGSNQRVKNNYFFNYTLGMYVAPNFTNTTLNILVEGNHFYCSDAGIFLWRGVEIGYLEVNGVLITGNSFYFDDYTYTGQPSYKAAVAYQGQLTTEQGAINNVKISNNIATNVGTTLLSQFVRWDTPTPAASQKCKNISITENQVKGFTDGAYIVTNSDNGQGFTEISRNQFIDLTPDSLANPPHGIYINATGDGVDILVVDGNIFVDSRGGSAVFENGIYLTNGTITSAFIGPQVYSGLTSANYTEAGSITITNWLGPARAGVNNIAYSASMTPDWAAGEEQRITATNGTAFTINAPLHPQTGARMTIMIRNTSGGALGAVTWDGVYGLSAWTQPATGFSRSITFRYDGSLWIQVSQTGVDVVN